MHCYLSLGPWGMWSEIFSSLESLSSFEWVFPEDVHVGRLWIAMISSENELTVDFTAWSLAEWNSSLATRSSIDGNNLPKGSHLRFPVGETLSNCGGMQTLAEILHCLFQTQIHGFLHLCTSSDGSSVGKASPALWTCCWSLLTQSYPCVLWSKCGVLTPFL